MAPELGKALAQDITRLGKLLPAVPSKPEVWALFGVAKTLRDLIIVRTFYASAVRNSELVHLWVADLLPDTYELFIRTGKEWAAYCTSSF
jgi:site-specific recombinase XerD